MDKAGQLSGQVRSRRGLYDPRHEHDSCGVGFVADPSGAASNRILRLGLTALARVEHRGGTAADGKTGDGAGVLTRIPWGLLEDELGDAVAPKDGLRGLGMFFLPPDRVEDARRLINAELERVGAKAAAWREVPVDPSALGERAQRTRPAIWQVAVTHAGMETAEDLDRVLFLARRRCEREASARGWSEHFYVSSMSARTVVYKALAASPRLPSFFGDLTDDRYETALTVFHQRFSTNTLPSWALAQPFRMSAHNGEFNTLRGNLSWLHTREPNLLSEAFGDDIADLTPIADPTESDSSCFDRVVELLVAGGRKPTRAVCMLMPEPFMHMPDMDEHVRAMVIYNADVVEPWDGPAAVVATDGRYVVAGRDRNGLRPLRFWRTADGLVIAASESGLVHAEVGAPVESGRIGTGGLLAVDLDKGRVLENDELKLEMSRELPYMQWVEERLHCVEAKSSIRQDGPLAAMDGPELLREQRRFGYGKEHLERVIEPMTNESKVPVGSMGDDTPLAAFSEKPQQLYRFFKQRFAQVTNPAIDPIRERLNMSLSTSMGRHANLLDDGPGVVDLIRFPSPVISTEQFEWLLTESREAHGAKWLRAAMPAGGDGAAIRQRIEELCQEAEAAISEGVISLVVTDRGLSENESAVPMLLAVSALHHRLADRGLRLKATIIADAGEVLEDHQAACLLGFGATIVHPWLALQTVRAMHPEEERRAAVARYREAMDAGILKIMAKMGVTVIQSYRGARLFEAVGLSRELCDEYFGGVDSPVSGVGLEHLAAYAEQFRQRALEPTHSNGKPAALVELGLYRVTKNGEDHAYNSPLVRSLQKAVRTDDDQAAEAFEEFNRLASGEGPPIGLRDIMSLSSDSGPVPLDEVEPIESVFARFTTQAMSHGALAREVHELLAVAMNRLGGKSNSGEGGEAPERFRPYGDDNARNDSVFYSDWKPTDGDWGNSRIKQIATGRFGVTPAYLRAAEEIEIKVCQGAKPGEGGQIPGFKVSVEIGALRHARPGTPLISPPPHHDIYSIEDLEELIYDLKRVNPRAYVTVKLVASTGVGTIAAGVAKSYADVIQISGNDGGTGAAPLSSILHAGIPWEIGLAETRQVLEINHLRGRVRLRVDGGLKSARDVLVAACLGAEEFGFGTAALVASGCIMARKCHLNTCPVGVATQDPKLRAKLPGRPEHIVRFFTSTAHEVRKQLAALGVRSLGELVGRVDLLKPRSDLSATAQSRPGVLAIDLSGVLAGVPDRDASSWSGERNDRPERVTPLDDTVLEACLPKLDSGEPIEASFEITNNGRTVGSRLAGEIAERRAQGRLGDVDVRLGFTGIGGQSFAAFCTSGMTMELAGEAEDYVGKSMDGGTIILRRPEGWPETGSIAGNTVLYGATGGRLFAAGDAGDRFAVRNSGATAVVEACGDHGCEYMTGGTVVVLGRIGRNFAAGMTGGRAFVLDPDNYLDRHHTSAGVAIRSFADQAERDELRALIEEHLRLTGSPTARAMLGDWENVCANFDVVAPEAAEPAPGAEPAPADDEPKRDDARPSKTERPAPTVATRTRHRVAPRARTEQAMEGDDRTAPSARPTIHIRASQAETDAAEPR